MTSELEDAFVSGLLIGTGQVAHCDVCGVYLRANHRVEVLVLFDDGAVSIPATRCSGCARGELAEADRPC